MDGALNDEPRKNPMLDAVLGAAVALFFGGGTYALFLNSGGQLSIPADPTDVRNAGWDGKQFTKVKNESYKGWRKNFTDEELEQMGDNPTKAQEAAVLAARRRAYIYSHRRNNRSGARRRLHVIRLPVLRRGQSRTS